MMEPVFEGEEPPLIERVGVLLSDEETEAVRERVTEGVTDLLAVMLGVRLREGDREGVEDLVLLGEGVFVMAVGLLLEDREMLGVLLRVGELLGVLLRVAVGERVFERVGDGVFVT